MHLNGMNRLRRKAIFKLREPLAAIKSYGEYLQQRIAEKKRVKSVDYLNIGT